MEYQLLFQYLLDGFTFDTASRNYAECEKAISKHINEMTAVERRNTVNLVLDRNRHLYNSYCKAVDN